MEIGEKIDRKNERPYYSEQEIGKPYGEHEILTVPIDRLAILPQVRGNKANPAQSQLTESIRNNKLVNPIDIALLDSRQFESHLGFVNGIWGTKAELSDYGEPNNGFYPVLIAGHSRVLALKTIQAENQSPVGVVCKVHDISSSAEFLSLQLAENIYSGINPERRAMAVVEMYHFGYCVDAAPKDILHWSSYVDFVRKNPGNLSKEVLSDGMAFAALSPEVRDYVFAGKIYYAAGVEIGKNAQTIMDYVKFRLGEEATKEEVTEAYSFELAILIDHLVNSKQNSKGGLGKMVDHINGQVNYMKELINNQQQNNFQQLMLDMIHNAPYEQRQQYISLLKKQHKELVNQLKRHPANLAVEYLKLDEALTGEDRSVDIDEVEKAYMKNIGRGILESLIDLE